MKTEFGMLATLVVFAVNGVAHAAEARATDAGPAPEQVALAEVPPAPPAQVEVRVKAPEPTPPDVKRKWGLGSNFGGGASVLTLGGKGYVGPGIQLPTLEVQAFTKSGNSVGISVPLLSVTVLSALAQTFALGADVYYNFNFGSGTARFIVGPGVGFLFAATDQAVGGALRVPAVVGVEFLTEGRMFGFKIAAQPYVQFTFAELQTEIEMLRQLNYHCVRMYVAGQECTRETSMAKLAAGRIVRRVADWCLQFHGGYGYMDEFLVSRYWRDARLLSIGGGADEVMLQIIAKLEGYGNV